MKNDKGMKWWMHEIWTKSEVCFSDKKDLSSIEILL